MGNSGEVERTLFDFFDDIRPKARSTDVGTSHAAAAAASEMAEDHRRSVYAAIQTYGPMTSYEIGEKVGLTNVQVTRRVSEMLQVGVLRRHIVATMPDGKELYKTRKTPTGRQACVIHLAEGVNRQECSACGVENG